MNKPKIHIVGDGVFGTFLKELLQPYVDFSTEADNIILAVPSSAYEEVAEKYSGKHLINVCSVQEKTNDTCSRHSCFVTGFHPLFGKNSPEHGRTCIVTRTCAYTAEIIELFEKINCQMVYSFNGEKINGEIHDRLMRKVHLPVLEFGEWALTIVEQAKDIPDNLMPPSFKKLRDFAYQIKDIGEGTKESIKSNRDKKSPQLVKGTYSER